VSLNKVSFTGTEEDPNDSPTFTAKYTVWQRLHVHGCYDEVSLKEVSQNIITGIINSLDFNLMKHHCCAPWQG
jgi:hypothetical protein